MKVSIYIETDGGGMNRRYRTYAAIVEFILKNGDPVTRELRGTEAATGNRIMLVALVNALKLLNKPCVADIYMDSCPYVSENIKQKRMLEWASNDWRTTKGEETANRAEWEAMIKLLKMHRLSFPSPGKHSYSDRLQYDIRKLKECDMQCHQEQIDETKEDYSA